MHETSPPSRWGEARGSGWGPPRPTALQTHCRPAGTRRASRDAHRQRPDVPTEVYDPSTQAPRRLRRPVRPDMTRRSKVTRSDNGRRAPRAGGWRGRAARFGSKLSGGATKDLYGNQYFEYSTVRSTHELLPLQHTDARRCVHGRLRVECAGSHLALVGC